MRHLPVLAAVTVSVVVLVAALLTRRDETPTETPTETPATVPATRKDTDGDTAVRKLAERYLAAIGAHDDTTVAALNCARAAPGLIQIAADGRPVTMTGELERATSHDRYHVALTIGGRPGGRMIITRQDGRWCVRD